VSAGRIVVPLEGRIVEVPVAALEAELGRRGPIASLALLEGLVRSAAGLSAHSLARGAVIARLLEGIEPLQPGTITLLSLLGLVRLDAVEAAARLDELAARLPAPLSLVARAAADSVAGHFEALAQAIASDDALAQRAPLVLSATVRPPDELAPALAALLDALARLQPTLGVTAYRAFLGDLAEALFRALQRGGHIEHLLGTSGAPNGTPDGLPGNLIDRLCAELPSTPDLVAARGMAWLLGTIAPASDDAVRSALERARARFRDPAFHRDCAAMLGELPGLGWPPPAPAVGSPADRV
jgi:hypothetical protein